METLLDREGKTETEQDSNLPRHSEADKYGPDDRMKRITGLEEEVTPIEDVLTAQISDVRQIDPIDTFPGIITMVWL